MKEGKGTIITTSDDGLMNFMRKTFGKFVFTSFSFEKQKISCFCHLNETDDEFMIGFDNGNVRYIYKKDLQGSMQSEQADISQSPEINKIIFD